MLDAVRLLINKALTSSFTFLPSTSTPVPHPALTLVTRIFSSASTHSRPLLTSRPTRRPQLWDRLQHNRSAHASF